MASVSTCYISTGCNRTPHAADWGHNDLICYGSCNSVAIYNPEDGCLPSAGVKCTLNEHTESVNCVRWIRGSSLMELVSASVDKTAVIWQLQEEKFSVTAVLKGHSGPVTAVDALSFPARTEETTNHRTIVVTTSSDSTIKIWEKQRNNDYVNSKTFCFGTGFLLDVSLAVIPHTNVPILAGGGDDHKIHIYVEQNAEFVRLMILTGHEDWIRTLEFTVDDNSDLLLASAAQDHMIRLWRFSQRDTDTGNSYQSIADLPASEDIKMRENTISFKYKGQLLVYAVFVESILCGHDNWIYSVRWHPSLAKDGVSHQPMCLLSASMDKTMILWKPDPDSGIWVEQVRVGEIGGNTLGLYGGLFSPDGNSVLAHGYQGALHQWRHDKVIDLWEPVVTSSGHFDAVHDLDWDRDGGNFLLTVSSDQTARLHAPWVHKDRQVLWYEIARPQVHGYDLHCITMLHKYKFVSGADEKVTRAFDAPKNFIENFCTICGLDLEKEFLKEDSSFRPEGASVPALGLSNKAVFPGDSSALKSDLQIQPHPNEQYPEIYFTATLLIAPPTEEHLLQNTLWPETHKLYGHGYEIFAVACDPDGKILASSCKAAKANFAGVILWDTETWKQLCILESHNLTVTQMAFSHCGKYLLSVSRDRTWALFRKRPPNLAQATLFQRIASVEKQTSPHSRIIWSCAWSHDDKFFITASRDKKVMIWSRPDWTGADASRDDQCKPFAVLDVGSSATAVDMAPVGLEGRRYLVAVGLESGDILIYKWKENLPQHANSWSKCVTLDKQCSHHLSVKRVKFRPGAGLAGVKEQWNDANFLQLASCSTDHSVRIFNISLKDL